MTFHGFSKSDFATFTIDGLAPRMEAIQQNIQPKFKQLGEVLTSELEMMLGKEMHLHIARHARRKVNPPNDTWLAVADNKRGYKKHPHFQVGLWDDRLFIWLAFIYELPNKQNIAQVFRNHIDKFETLPQDFHISLDHMKKGAETLANIDLEAALQRFYQVKKAEFLVGKYIAADDPVLQSGEALTNYIIEIYEQLIPFYQLSYQSI